MRAGPNQIEALAGLRPRRSPTQNVIAAEAATQVTSPQACARKLANRVATRSPFRDPAPLGAVIWAPAFAGVTLVGVVASCVLQATAAPPSTEWGTETTTPASNAHTS